MKGYRFVLFDKDIKDNAIRHLSGLEVGAQPVWEVILQPKKKIRTNTQNNTYWRWIGELVGETGYSKNELHVIFGKEFLPMVEVKLGHIVEEVPKSTKDLSSSEFSDYLLQIEAFCATEIGHILS